MADRQQQQDEPAAADPPSAGEPPAGPAHQAVATDEITATTVLQTVWTATNSLAFTFAVYALGFWRIAAASTWVLLPVMAVVSVVRDRWREAGRVRRRRAQLAAAANERDLITANVSELPSWVFFPDVHRAEWLNQVPRSSPPPPRTQSRPMPMMSRYRYRKIFFGVPSSRYFSQSFTNCARALNGFSHRSLPSNLPNSNFNSFQFVQ